MYCRLFLLQKHQNARKILWRLAAEGHLFFAMGMDKGNFACMETLPVKQGGMLFLERSLSASIYGISQNRVSDIAHMNADLVRTACLQFTFQISISCRVFAAGLAAALEAL